MGCTGAKLGYLCLYCVFSSLSSMSSKYVCLSQVCSCFSVISLPLPVCLSKQKNQKLLINRVGLGKAWLLIPLLCVFPLSLSFSSLFSKHVYMSQVCFCFSVISLPLPICLSKQKNQKLLIKRVVLGQSLAPYVSIVCFPLSPLCLVSMSVYLRYVFVSLSSLSLCLSVSLN